MSIKDNVGVKIQTGMLTRRNWKRGGESDDITTYFYSLFIDFTWLQLVPHFKGFFP